MRKVLAAAVAAILLYSGCLWPVHAQTPEIQRITQTESTIDCIGDPKTALCAAETFIACWVRKQRSLCDAVKAPRLDFADPEVVFDFIELIVENQRSMGADETAELLKNIPDEIRDIAKFKPSLVEITFNLHKKFTDTPAEAPPEWVKYDVIVGRAQDRWRVVSWVQWGFEEFKERGAPK